MDGYFLRDTVNDRTKIKNTGFYQLTDDIPVSGAEYFAYSFGRQGKHWSYPVFLFNNWGDSVPLRMFQLQSADGQNYTASDYKQIITNSDINVQNNTAKTLLTSIKDNVMVLEPQGTYYIIRNDYCFVSLSAIKMTSTTGGIVFTNLPRPVGRVNFTLHLAGGDSKPIIWGLIEDGSTNIHFNDVKTELLNIASWCSFCYPIAK
ncbi:MAG TPA: hypothetical protein IAC14_01955 [Candidatus Scybalomonas excrementigallinarum]|nr:hypothetical protein [Candidatus Scybalomonas excrementigallinarum]